MRVVPARHQFAARLIQRGAPRAGAGALSGVLVPGVKGGPKEVLQRWGERAEQMKRRRLGRGVGDKRKQTANDAVAGLGWTVQATERVAALLQGQKDQRRQREAVVVLIAADGMKVRFWRVLSFRFPVSSLFDFSAFYEKLETEN